MAKISQDQIDVARDVLEWLVSACCLDDFVLGKYEYLGDAARNDISGRARETDIEIFESEDIEEALQAYINCREKGG